MARLSSYLFLIMLSWIIPMFSAFSVTCSANTPSEIQVNWQHSSLAYLRGTRMHYTIYYQKYGNHSNPVSFESQEDPNGRTIFIPRLEYFTKYWVWLTASTKMGEGNRTEPIICRSSHYIPEFAPSNVEVTSYFAPHDIKVKWERITKWRGFPLGYNLYYRLVILGDEEVMKGEKKLAVDGKSLTAHVITGLEVHGVYDISIAGRTKFGEGTRSSLFRAATCRVPDSIISLNYFPLPPYIIDADNTNDIRPSGLLINIAETSILHCAHHCSSFNQSIQLNFSRLNYDYLMNATSFSEVDGVSSFYIPRVKKPTMSKTVFSLLESPGPVLIKVPLTSEELELDREGKILSGIFQIVPLCLLYLLLNCIFGFGFWFFEPTNVEKKHPLLSLNGLFEGMYLIVMTSTTVGYGDKVPRTFAGRVYIMTWTLFGIVLTAFVIGSITSSLSSQVIAEIQTKVPKAKTIAVAGTYEHLWADKYLRNNLVKDPLYKTSKELIEELKTRRVRYAVLDSYVAEHLKVELVKNEFQIKAVNIGDEADFGVEAFDELKKLEKCVVKFVKDNAEIMKEAVFELKNKKVAKEDQKVDLKPKKVDSFLVSSHSPVYQRTLQWLLGLLVVFVIFGNLFALFRAKRETKRMNKIATSTEIALKKQEDLRKHWREVLKTMQENMATLENMTNTMELRHANELKCFIDKISNIVGINFRYVKISELPIPIKRVIDFNEERKKNNSTLIAKLKKWLKLR